MKTKINLLSDSALKRAQTYDVTLYSRIMLCTHDMDSEVATAFHNAVADPGFPVGGATVGGLWTSDAGAFR